MRYASLILAMMAAGCLQVPASGDQRDAMTLQPDRLPGMCLTLGSADGGSISMPCDGSPAQSLILPGPEGGPIRHAGACLAPRGEGNYPQLYPLACDGSRAQTWTINADGHIRNGDGRCLALLGGGSSRAGVLIYGWECLSGYEPPVWRARSPKPSQVIEASLESSVRPGMCIGYDVYLGLYPCSDSYTQAISFDEKSKGQLRMKGSCFAGGYAFDGLSLSECWDLDAQRWTMAADGSFANDSGECIELTSDGGRDSLRARPCRGSPQQRWNVRKELQP